MIITITGKPCSGKGTVSKEFCKKYGFEYICTGDMFRSYAQQFGYDDILTFQEEDPRVKQIDNLVDNKIKEIGITRANENILIDSRLAWHFVPKSFKVFIDVDEVNGGKRLMEAKRKTEQTQSLEEAIQKLKNRWQIENERYLELYNINNTNLKNYDLVIDSSNQTPSEIVDIIFKNYTNINQHNL